MPITLEQLTSRYEPLFSAWEHAGRRLYLVGGCVRDVVMKLDSIGDVDLATDATPEETSEILAANGWKVIPIGARFGTIATLIRGQQVEITTFRVAETYERTSRKPEVVFGTSLEEDLSRRDLSINAMAAGIDARVIDPFGGCAAIEEGRLEVPGGGLDHTRSILQDDPLRLLRVARFAARLGFQPTNETTAAARETADELHNISRERWKMEMDKLLAAGRPADGLRWLHQVRALDVILPAWSEVRDANLSEPVIDEVARSVEDVGVRWSLLQLWTSWVAHTGERPVYDEPRGTLDAATRVEDAERTARSFRFSNDERRALRTLSGIERRLVDMRPPWTRRRLRRWLYEYGDLGQSVMHVLTGLSVRDERWEWLRTGLEELQAASLSESPDPRLPDGFGRDVIAAFELGRGPAISSAIECLREAIVDGEVENGASADSYLAWLARHEQRWRWKEDPTSD